MATIITFLIDRLRIQWARDVSARVMRLARIHEQIIKLTRYREIFSEINHGRTYVEATAKLVVLANRYDSLKFWFEPRTYVKATPFRVNRIFNHPQPKPKK